jgi:uncharacterized protein YxjI
VSANYLIARKWAVTDRFAITDETGTPQFEVQGRLALSRQLSVRDAAGAEVAVISRRGWSTRYEIVAGGVTTAVRPRGFLGNRFEILSPGSAMEARGNFSGRQYSITSSGVQVAAVTQLRTFRERFAVEVAEGQDAVLMLAIVLVIETIRDDRRRQAGAAGAAGGAAAAAGG